MKKIFSIWAAAVLSFAAVGPAVAHHKVGHEKGQGNGQHSAGDSRTDCTTDRGCSRSRPDQDGIGADHGVVNDDKIHDGNNGCGNDPDREDDNNGRCRGKAKNKPTPRPSATPTPSGTPSPSPTASTGGGPKHSPSPTSGGGGGVTPAPNTDTVEGANETVERGEKSDTSGVRIPFTGTDVDLVVLIALALLSVGLLIYFVTRNKNG